MIDGGGGDKLAEEDEEDRVSDPEMGRDIGDRQDVDGDETAAEKQVAGLLGQKPDG